MGERLEARIRSWVLVAALGAWLLGGAGCLFPQCEHPPECDEPDRPYRCGWRCGECCEDSQCGSGLACRQDLTCGPPCINPGPVLCSDGCEHVCCRDDDCRAGEECTPDYACKLICADLAEDCAPAGAPCCDGLACDVFTSTCREACTSDEDCLAAHQDVDFASDLRCLPDGSCDFAHCQDDSDCDPHMVCYSGDCLTPTCALDASCAIVPGQVAVREGSSVRLMAWPQLPSGAFVPGIRFDWSSSNEAVASASEGLVTGGASGGSATITASDPACGISCSVEVRNLGPGGDGVRVLVVDAANGAPLAGVHVEVDGVGSADTDADGLALFAGADLSASPATVTASAQDVAYLSLARADSNDLLLPVSLQPDPPRAGGVRGTMDFERLGCDPDHPCEVRLGAAGLSSPAWPLDWSLADMLGEPVMGNIHLGGKVLDVAYPSAVAFGLLDTWFRQEIHALGAAGPRITWGLGGRLDLANLIELMGPLWEGGSADQFRALGSTIDLFVSLGTSLGPLVQVAPVDKVPDEGDVDGDGLTDDLVPAYDALPALPDPLVLKVPSLHTMRVEVPELPLDQAGGHLYDAVIVVAGVFVDGAGLVPLGLAMVPDAPTDSDLPDGFVDEFALRFSDVDGRLPEGSYRRAVLALALRSDQLATDADPREPFATSGQAVFVDRFPDQLTLRPFGQPPIFQFDPDGRALTVQYLDEESGLMVVLGQAEGQAPGTGLEWELVARPALGPFALPAAPPAGDRLDRVGLAWLRLADGVTFSDLAAFSGDELDDLARVVTDFAVVYPAGHGPLIGCQSAGADAGARGILVALCLLALVVRRRGRRV